MTNTNPTQTPNVVITNPAVRKTIRIILDTVGAAAFLANIADISSSAFDISEYTFPVLAVYAAARALFGFGVDNPNTPKL